MAGMTTDELIKQVLGHSDDGCFLHGECDTYQSAPLLARKLERAMESLEKLDLDAMVTLSREVQEIAATAIAEIEAMQ